MGGRVKGACNEIAASQDLPADLGNLDGLDGQEVDTGQQEEVA
ncbi:hypothetical protein [Burkholderia thailandensis]|nr:hypothetical protein [Burkholderia thailandensis]MCS6515103.1 hypothetical protein [Burkholderia thailandensis]